MRHRFFHTPLLHLSKLLVGKRGQTLAKRMAGADLSRVEFLVERRIIVEDHQFLPGHVPKQVGISAQLGEVPSSFWIQSNKEPKPFISTGHTLGNLAKVAHARKKLMRN